MAKSAFASAKREIPTLSAYGCALGPDAHDTGPRIGASGPAPPTPLVPAPPPDSAAATVFPAGSMLPNQLAVLIPAPPKCPAPAVDEESADIGAIAADIADIGAIAAIDSGCANSDSGCDNVDSGCDNIDPPDCEISDDRPLPGSANSDDVPLPGSDNSDDIPLPGCDNGVFPDWNPDVLVDCDPGVFPDCDPGALPDCDPDVFGELPDCEPDVFPECEPDVFPDCCENSALPDCDPGTLPDCDNPLPDCANPLPDCENSALPGCANSALPDCDNGDMVASTGLPPAREKRLFGPAKRLPGVTGGIPPGPVGPGIDELGGGGSGWSAAAVVADSALYEEYALTAMVVYAKYSARLAMIAGVFCPRMLVATSCTNWALFAANCAGVGVICFAASNAAPAAWIWVAAVLICWPALASHI
jgi:hypothetical protein